MIITFFIQIKIINYRHKRILNNIYIIINKFFIFKYSSCVNSKNLSLQIFIKYEQVLNISVLSLIFFYMFFFCNNNYWHNKFFA